MAFFVYVTKEYISSDYTINENEIGIVEVEKNTTSNVQFVNCPILIEIPNEFLKRFEPQKTGDQFAQKVCNRCNRLLPVENFQRNQKGGRKKSTLLCYIMKSKNFIR